MKETLPNRVRLGAFEVNLRAGELWADGQVIRLQEQPFQILRMLIESNGEVVAREAIQKKLWPNDTVVEFDHSINTAIKKLRQAFGDSADKPFYIGTVARRGYRLLIAVTMPGASTSEGSAPSPPPALELREDAVSTLEGSFVGKKVSHYRVLELIGGGGMGMVYKAEDLKLGRRVALKFLPEELASDPLALKRFEREARTASSLEHPNICAIYGVEDHQDRPFIVMQYLEGETLRDRLARVKTGDKTLPLNELLEIATQVCRGLQAAHAKNIIHRDIKPANIFLTYGGEAKILDFGVAKLIEFPDFEVEVPSGSGDRPTIDRTLSALSLTRTGVALGTAGYMSPEQVQGERLDARTDLFSLGLVLYEMSTGQRAFSGETAALLHEAIVNQPAVPIRTLNPALPPKLDAIVTKALEKDRNLRYQQAAEISADLDRLKQAGATRYRRWAIAIAIVLVIAAIGGVWWLRQREPLTLPDLKLRQLTHSLNDNPVRTGAISPDGRYLAYTDFKGIHVELLETGHTRSIPQPDTVPGRQDGWGMSSGSRTAKVSSSTSALPTTIACRISILAYGGSSSTATHLANFATTRSQFRFLLTESGRVPHDIKKTGRLPGNLADDARRTGRPAKLLETDDSGEFIGAQWSADGHRLNYGKVEDNVATNWSTDFESTPVAAMSFPVSMVSGLALPDGRAFYVLSESGNNDYDCNVWSIRIDPYNWKTHQRSPSAYRLEWLLR